ncbi:hypothetical protein GCM10010109_79600 [Actinoplanes campanulatus]|nr:hypothetical protein GCM10010109_79600 [Actinoplanes campanulatus]GID41161.1 hypothetical protein Aca09nite_76670 [Actinoplanes campanulatus]
MFAGLDEIDWASMTHAYGPATAMPKVIRGLVSPKKGQRTRAMEYLEGAVHHQFDVYECTVAAIPFLIEAAAAPEVRGRHDVLRLLVSIGSAETDDVGELADSDGRLRRSAQQAVAAGFETFAALLADPQRRVRQTAPEALLVCHDRAGDVADLLRDRMSVESDTGVQTALVEAVGVITRRAVSGHQHEVDAASLLAWLRAVYTSPAPVEVRIVALRELLRLDAGDRPDLVPTLLGLLDEADGFDLGALCTALGDRVTERNQVLSTIVRDGPAGRRNSAMWDTRRSMQQWRGDYRELLAAFAALLTESGEDHLLAVGLLTDKAWPLTAPVADDIAASIARSLAAGASVYCGGSAHPQHPQGGNVWPLALTLIRLGDPRGLPLIQRAYEGDVLPDHTGPLLRPYGADAAGLVPAIRRWLQRLTADGDHKPAMRLLRGLTHIGPAAADALPEIVALLPYQDHWSLPLKALAALGPAAASEEPLIRASLADPRPEVVAAAARALAAVEADGTEDALRPLLTHDDPEVCLGAADALRAAGATDVLVGYEHALRTNRYVRHHALESIGTMGAAAAPIAAQVKTLLTDACSQQLAATTTLWRITGDLDATLPILSAAWQRKRAAHIGIATCWAEMGPAAASVESLLRTELATATRATHWGSRDDAIEEDEEFLRACTRALTSIT